MKIHLPDYYTILVEEGMSLCRIIISVLLVCVLIADKQVGGLSVGRKQSRGGKAIKKPKKVCMDRFILHIQTLGFMCGCVLHVVSRSRLGLATRDYVACSLVLF